MATSASSAKAPRDIDEQSSSGPVQLKFVVELQVCLGIKLLDEPSGRTQRWNDRARVIRSALDRKNIKAKVTSDDALLDRWRIGGADVDQPRGLSMFFKLTSPVYNFEDRTRWSEDFNSVWEALNIPQNLVPVDEESQLKEQIFSFSTKVRLDCVYPPGIGDESSIRLQDLRSLAMAILENEQRWDSLWAGRRSLKSARSILNNYNFKGNIQNGLKMLASAKTAEKINDLMNPTTFCLDCMKNKAFVPRGHYRWNFQSVYGMVESRQAPISVNGGVPSGVNTSAIVQAVCCFAIDAISTGRRDGDAWNASTAKKEDLHLFGPLRDMIHHGASYCGMSYSSMFSLLDLWVGAHIISYPATFNMNLLDEGLVPDKKVKPDIIQDIRLKARARRFPDEWREFLLYKARKEFNKEYKLDIGRDTFLYATGYR